MGRNLALVRFPDGHIDFTVYSGSSDSVLPRLHDLGDAERLIGSRGSLLPELIPSALSWVFRPRDARPVEIWTDYGSGIHWFGVASRRRRVLLDGTSPYEGPRTPPLRGVPGWVPEAFVQHPTSDPGCAC